MNPNIAYNASYAIGLALVLVGSYFKIITPNYSVPLITAIMSSWLSLQIVPPKLQSQVKMVATIQAHHDTGTPAEVTQPTLPLPTQKGE